MDMVPNNHHSMSEDEPGARDEIRNRSAWCVLIWRWSMVGKAGLWWGLRAAGQCASRNTGNDGEDE